MDNTPQPFLLDLENVGPEFDRTNLTWAIAQRTGINPYYIKEVLKGFFAVLPDALVQYERVEIHDGGVFRLETRAPRKGVTPDGDAWEVGERQEIVFHAAPAVNAVVTERTGVETYSN